MPASSSPCVLIVADPGRVAELAQAMSEPLPNSAVDLVVSSGGDDTIELFESRRPRVVVLTASLEVGDAKSLIETLRDMVPRDEMVIVLVGDDQTGPIRNALDAIDMKPDRFVSRPLSGKALRFAVSSGLDNVARALGESSIDRETVERALAESDAAAAAGDTGVATEGAGDRTQPNVPADDDRMPQPIGSRTSTPLRGSAGSGPRRSIPPTADMTPLSTEEPDTGQMADAVPGFQRTSTQPRGSGAINTVGDEPPTARVTAPRGSVSADEPVTARSTTATHGSVSPDEPVTARVTTATHGSVSPDEPVTARSTTATHGSVSPDEPVTARSTTATRGSASAHEPVMSRSTTATRGSGSVERTGPLERMTPSEASRGESPNIPRTPTPQRGSGPMPIVSDADAPFARSGTAPRFSSPVEAGDVPPVLSRTATRPVAMDTASNGEGDSPVVTRAKTDRGTGIADPGEPSVPRAPTDRGTGITAPPRDSTPEATRAALRARWEALADSIGDDDLADDDDDDITSEHDEVTPLPPIEIQPRKKGSTNPDFMPVPPVAPWRPGTTSELREDSELSAPVREPTLILHDDAPARVTPPISAAPPMPHSPGPPVSVTERSVNEPRWSQPVLLSELIDRSRDSSRELLANVGARDDLAGLDELDDDIIVGHPVHTPPPHTLRGGKLQALEDLVEPQPPPEPPARPSEERIGGRDFARQLRAKMSMMAQRLFSSDSPQSQPSVDVRPRHDHHTEIDLAALGEEPALGGGVTEIGRPQLSEPVQLTTSPGSWDTQVRERGLPDSGEIVRGVSDVAMILARMFAINFTGRVGFRKDDVEKVVFFDGGRPVFASSNEPGDRMGELLVREGKITASQYERCQAVAAESGRRMGEILVDTGYLKRRELLPAVRRHVEDILYSLFGWDRGHYHVTADPTASSERIRLSRHPASLVLEGIRRKLDRTTLEKVLGPPSTVIEVPDRERLGGILNTGDLAAEERTALGAFDGQADLAQVARVTGVDIADVLPLAWGLCVLGLANARRAETEVEESTALVGETDLAIDRERVRARWQLVTEADYFALLGVRRDATGFEIRRAYQSARRDFAPDGFPTDLRRELARELEDIASVLDEAFRVLRDDRLRQTYLANLIE